MSVGTMQLEGQPGHIVVTDHLGNVSKLVFQPKWVNAYVTPSPEDPTWTGILGNANGDRDDDFVTRDGQSLGVEPGQAVIEGAFADSWRITDATSLFEYGAGESTATFTEVTYPAPHPEMDASELRSDREARQPQAEAVCQLVVTDPDVRSEENTSELQSLMRISYAVFCLKKKNINKK